MKSLKVWATFAAQQFLQQTGLGQALPHLKSGSVAGQ
jgi:hypothetical protein